MNFEFRLEGLNSPLGSATTIEVCLCCLVGLIDLLKRRRQFVTDLQFLFGEDGSRFCEAMLVVLNLSNRTSKTERHRELKPESPVCVLVGQQSRIGALVVRAVASQLIAERVDPVAGNEVEPRANEFFGSGVLQLEALDVPLLAAQFRTMHERFGEICVPVEGQFRSHWLGGRPNHVSVVHRQTHEATQSQLGTVEGSQGFFRPRPDFVVVVTSLGFIGEPDTLRLLVDSNLPPGSQSTLFGDHLRVVATVGQVQFPVGVLDVFDEIVDSRFEIGDRDVCSNSSNHDTLVDCWNSLQSRTADDTARDPGVLSTGPLRQRQPVGHSQAWVSTELRLKWS